MRVPIVVISIMFELNGWQVRLFRPSEIAGNSSLKSAIFPDNLARQLTALVLSCIVSEGIR